MKAIIIYIALVLGLIGWLYLSEKYTQKVMSTEWCYEEYEVDGTPNINSKYICENEKPN